MSQNKTKQKFMKADYFENKKLSYFGLENKSLISFCEVHITKKKKSLAFSTCMSSLSFQIYQELSQVMLHISKDPTKEQFWKVN